MPIIFTEVFPYAHFTCENIGYYTYVWLWYETTTLWFWYWCKIITLMLGIKWVTHKRTQAVCGFVWLDSEVTLLQWTVLHWVGIPVQRTNLLVVSWDIHTTVQILRNQKFPKFLKHDQYKHKSNRYIPHRSPIIIIIFFKCGGKSVSKTQHIRLYIKLYIRILGCILKTIFP